MHREIKQWLTLSLMDQVGPVTILKLIQNFGSVSAIFEQNRNSLNKIVRAGIVEQIISPANTIKVNETLAWMEQDNKHHILCLDDELYPLELAEITNPPPIIYALGNLNLLKKIKIAMVGTRAASEQGLRNSYMFAKELAKNNITVVSGLALGIDASAHQGALNEIGGTIAILGTGVDIVYPSSNRNLYQKILENKGLIISEFPLKTTPLHTNFPRRNRIIVGLAVACLVVESRVEGGAMISAEFALQMGRDVFAIPGSIHNPSARGCHRLIKQGAKLIETIDDVLEEIKSNHLTKAVIIKESSDPVLRAMGAEAIDIDKLSIKLNMKLEALCARLLELELAGEIIGCGGNRYQRNYKNELFL